MLYLTRILSNCAIARQVSCADTQASTDVVMGHGSRSPFTATALATRYHTVKRGARGERGGERRAGEGAVTFSR